MRKQQYETSARIAMLALIAMVVSLTINIAIGKSNEKAKPQERYTAEPVIWTPSMEEQRRMDSLYSIDAATKSDIDSIRNMIDAILIKLD